MGGTRPVRDDCAVETLELGFSIADREDISTLVIYGMYFYSYGPGTELGIGEGREGREEGRVWVWENISGEILFSKHERKITGTGRYD